MAIGVCVYLYPSERSGISCVSFNETGGPAIYWPLYSAIWAMNVGRNGIGIRAKKGLYFEFLEVAGLFQGHLHIIYIFVLCLQLNI